MKNAISLIMSAVFGLILFACSPSGQDRSEDDSHTILDELHDQVMAIHDEIMPKMGDIMDYKAKARTELDSLMQLGEDGYQLRKDQLVEIQSSLEAADHAMMDWMHQFEPSIDSISHEKAMEYLRSEKERITKVKEIMIQALEDAREVMAEEQ